MLLKFYTSLIFLMSFIFLAISVSADVIEYNNGYKEDCEIIEKQNYLIKAICRGSDLTIHFDEIKSINGQPVIPPPPSIDESVKTLTVMYRYTGEYVGEGKLIVDYENDKIFNEDKYVFKVNGKEVAFNYKSVELSDGLYEFWDDAKKIIKVPKEVVQGKKGWVRRPVSFPDSYEDVQGYITRCLVYGPSNSPSSKKCFWNGMVLKEENYYKKYNKLAEVIEINNEIKEEIFKIPSDYQADDFNMKNIIAEAADKYIKKNNIKVDPKQEALSDIDLARSNLKLISTAIETFAFVKKGKYPQNMNDLLLESPPYINTNFCGVTMNNYTYQCDFTSDGYAITAVSQEKDRPKISVVTGGIFKD